MYTQENKWEQIYSEGRQLNRAPYDSVVSFLYHHTPRGGGGDVNVLELGCGAGNNLWFAAREGWSVTGIDISQAAIHYAKNRFQEDNLPGDFIVGDFSVLATLDRKFDLVIERGALCCVPFNQAKDVIHMVSSIMNPHAKILLCAYSDRHSLCASGSFMENGMTRNAASKQSGTDELYFFSRRDMYELFSHDFVLESLVHEEKADMTTGNYNMIAQWIAVAQKNAEHKSV